MRPAVDTVRKERGPLERVLSLFADTRKGEGVSAVLFTLSVFFLLTSYYLLKTAREPLILESGAEIKSYSSAGQALLLIPMTYLYGLLARRVGRIRLITVVTLVFASNPRACRVVALATPTEKERGQWYFQRYVEQLPAAGEIVLFDRSWYNRAGVEHVMGFCTQEEYEEFLRACPLFEEMLVRSGILLLKYWFSVNDEEQERRFLDRMKNPIKRWKLSPMDVESRERWVEYSRAKDVMLEHTDRKRTPWYIVDADDKKAARLNCIAHLLRQIPYQDLVPVKIKLPPKQRNHGYKRPKKSAQRWVPKIY